jgi:outer membrane protein assembly factor BamE (lipoprotein component of BamABCDE complex)
MCATATCGKSQFLRMCVVLVGLTAVGLLAHIVVGPVVPNVQLSRVQIGMSRQSVREILGEPTNVFDERDWDFSRIGNAGWVRISFDDNGAVSQINDESP